MAGKTAVDVADRFFWRCDIAFEHVLDLVNAAAWRIQLIAKQVVGWAGRSAEPAVHASAKDTICICDVRIGELGQSEIGLQCLHSCVHASGIKYAERVKALLYAAAELGETVQLRLKDRDCGSQFFWCTD